MWLTIGELTIRVLLSFFCVSYVNSADVFCMRYIVDSAKYKVRAACCVANGVPSWLSILFLVYSLHVSSMF
jgi:hypothetical protein